VKKLILEGVMQTIAGVSGENLKQYIERIERLEEDKKNIASDITDVYAEAKSNGFDAKIIRQIIKIRKMDHAEREEMETLLDLYMSAIGMSVEA
jgi:uncharacterized protein (UPF0335 family)